MVLLRSLLPYLIVVLISVHSPLTWSLESEEPLPVYDVDQANLYSSNKFAIGVGIGVVKFDTNVKVTNKQSGLPIFIDLEGSLDLPDISHVTTLYSVYRFNRKHMMTFSYFGINRKSSLQIIDEVFDDVNIVNANVVVTDETSFYNLIYGYTLFYDTRSQIVLVAGINSMDMKLTTSAAGQIVVDGVVTTAEKLVEANIFAPLPLIGLKFGFNFTPQWSLTTAISLVTGSYQNVTASALQTEVNARYQISKNVGVLMGMTYFTATVDLDEETEFTEVTYGYTGASIGMHFAF